MEWLLIVDINIGCKNLLQSVVNNDNIIYRTYDAVVDLYELKRRL